jgi:hypothetical protein
MHQREADLDRRERARQLIEEGRALLDRGEIDTAIRTFDEATALDNSAGAAWNDLAVALFQKGEKDMAIGCLYTALKVDPTFSDAAINLATLLAEKGRATDGVPGLRGALFHDPENDEIRAMLQAMGVTQARPVAVVAVDPEMEEGRVIDPYFTAWNNLIVRPTEALVGALGPVAELSTWTAWLSAVRPEAIVLDPRYPNATMLRQAASQLGCVVAVLGEDLPLGPPYVELARALAVGVRPARATWDDVERPAPALSVLVQATHLAHAINVLDRLATQDLPPGLFEVLIVDRAYGEPATSLVEATDYGYELRILRAEGAGLGAAHQLALEQARGAMLVFFDEEARPAAGNLRGHLEAHARARAPIAVLGDFRMHPNLVDNSLRKLIDTTTTLYAQPGLVHGTEHGGPAFRANNLSVRRADVVAVGGFDPLFSAGCDDTDLGVRLEARRGIRVRFDQNIACDVDYPFTIGDVQVEQLIRGWACWHLAKKHGEPKFLIDPHREVLDEAWVAERRGLSERGAAQARDLAQRIQAVCAAEEPYRKTGAAEFLGDIVQVIGMQAFNRGTAIAASGFRLEDERMPGSWLASPTPVVIRPGGDVTATLRALAEGEADIVVYTDETASWPGLEVRPGGWAEAVASGSPAVVVLEAGFAPAPGWRSVWFAEIEAWPDLGAVVSVPAGPTRNRPSPPAMALIAVPAVGRIGDEDGTWVAADNLKERLGAVGFRVVAAPTPVTEVAPALERAS